MVRDAVSSLDVCEPLCLKRDAQTLHAERFSVRGIAPDKLEELSDVVADVEFVVELRMRAGNLNLCRMWEGQRDAVAPWRGPSLRMYAWIKQGIKFFSARGWKFRTSPRQPRGCRGIGWQR